MIPVEMLDFHASFKVYPFLSITNNFYLIEKKKIFLTIDLRIILLMINYCIISNSELVVMLKIFIQYE